MRQTPPEPQPIAGRNWLDGAVRELFIPSRSDARGMLLPIEFADLPFHPQRSFVIGGVPPGTVRGRHAHRRTEQLLLCPAGAVLVELHRNGAQATVLLDDPHHGLLVTPGVWAAQTYLLPDTMLLVLASRPYDPDDYVAEATG